ncbi:hypothetical protein COOONC_11508 [Cooperia oncophora]
MLKNRSISTTPKQGQDALRSFQRYGLSNIYGIKSMLSKKDLVPFPLIYAIDTTTKNLRSTLDFTSTTFSVEKNSTEDPSMNDVDAVPIPIPIGKTPKSYTLIRTAAPSTFVHRDEHSGRSGIPIQMVEIRKVKRIGGGYPYGPRNLSIVEYSQSLKVEKCTGNSIAFKTPKIHQSLPPQSADVWAIRRLDQISTMGNANLSCQYCVTYWKMQTKFKPINVYVYCCK